MKTPLEDLIYVLNKSAKISGNEDYQKGLAFAVSLAETQLKKEAALIEKVVQFGIGYTLAKHKISYTDYEAEETTKTICKKFKKALSTHEAAPGD